jgi:hypothetical protein
VREVERRPNYGGNDRRWIEDPEEVCESSADICFIGVVFHTFKEFLITGGTCLDIVSLP